MIGNCRGHGHRALRCDSPKLAAFAVFNRAADDLERIVVEEGCARSHGVALQIASAAMISGEIDFVIEGFDETLTFRAGDTYFLPSKILHNETRITEDFQVLELYGPAKAGTVQLEAEVN